MNKSHVSQQITYGLLELMEKVPFVQITVSQIARQAQVGRASFYRHFSSKEEVIRQHLADLFREWGQEFESLGKFEELTPSLLRHFYKHRRSYLLLHRSGLSHSVLDAILGCMDFDGKSDAEIYFLNWYAGGLYGVIEEWLRRGMQETAEEMLAHFSK